MAGKARNEPHERIAGDDAHNHMLPCSHNGHNENKMGTQRNNFRLVTYFAVIKTPGDIVEFQMAVGEVWVKRNGQWLIRGYSGTLIK